jgi:hypothetical protein
MRDVEQVHTPGPWALPAVASWILTLGVALTVAWFSPAHGQTPFPEPGPPGVTPHSPRDNTLEVWGGMGIPLTHKSFTEFWKRGPALGMGLTVRMTNNVKIGFGAEAALYAFQRGAFAERFPDLPVYVRHQALVHLYLFIRNFFYPGRRFSPYLGGDLGFARISGAENKDLINGVRVTYYEIPGATRLAVGTVAGADYYFFKGFAVQADLRLMYLHNDPNVGLFFLLRVGAKFKL